MVPNPKETQHFVHRGRFLRIDENREVPEKRVRPDRRQSLKGDASKSETGKERRVGSRRLEDVIITIKLQDPKLVYVNESSFNKSVIKQLQHEFTAACLSESVESLLNFIERPEKILVEAKLKYRDKIKRFALEKGLTFEVIDNGVYLGATEKKVKLGDTSNSENSIVSGDHETQEISTIIGFHPDALAVELDNIIFKVFIKCLNEIHPISGDQERDAIKQNDEAEKRIIYIARSYYPESISSDYKSVLGQVFAEVIIKYNKIIQLAAELSMLEERYRLSGDSNLSPVILAKTEDLQRLKNDTTGETVRTLYLYLDYFKEITKVGSVRERIENIFKKVNEKQLEILNLEQICHQLHQIIAIEDNIRQKKPDKIQEYLGYLQWLKQEITNEVYFLRHLWINNMKGRTFIEDAIQRTLQAIQE